MSPLPACPARATWSSPSSSAASTADLLRPCPPPPALVTAAARASRQLDRLPRNTRRQARTRRSQAPGSRNLRMIATLHACLAAPKRNASSLNWLPAPGLGRAQPAPALPGAPADWLAAAAGESSPRWYRARHAAQRIPPVYRPCCCNWSAPTPTASPPSTTSATASAATSGAYYALAFAGFAFDTATSLPNALLAVRPAARKPRWPVSLTLVLTAMHPQSLDR